MRRSRLVLVAGAVTALWLAPGPAHAQTPLSPGAWYEFLWWSGIAPVDDPFEGFFLSAVTPTRVRLTDVGFTGDAFDLFVNGTLLYSTPPAPSPGTYTSAMTGDEGWTTPGLSKGWFDLSAGDYLLTVNVRETAPGFDYGSGFIRADALPSTVTPEPLTIVSLGTGLAAVWAARRRRRGRNPTTDQKSGS